MLIGCSKTKQPYKSDPKRGGRLTPTELYAGQLFRKRVEYAESRGIPWAVLSARYGLWRPNTEMKPYDQCFKSLSPADKAAWHVGVAGRVIEELWEPFNTNTGSVLSPKDLIVEIHAGKDYASPLGEILQLLGVIVVCPCEGLGIGEQLAIYTAGDLICPGGDA